MDSVEEIYESMMDTYAEHTGLRPVVSCDMSLRFYAVANQIFALQAQTDWVKRQCFPQTAEGEYLDYQAEVRGLSRKAASTATGELRFSVSEVGTQDLTIALGTVAMTAGLVRVQTVEEAVLPAGSLYVDVKAEAVEAGEVGNVEAGRIITMAVAPVGIATCSNPEAFEHGTEIESDQELRERVLDTYKRLPNGANAAFYLQEALAVERVTAATVIPRSRGICTVDVVIAMTGGMPEEDLIAEVQAQLESKREIAVDVLVKAPELVEMDLEVLLSPVEGGSFAEAKAEAETAVAGWFDGSKLGESLLEGELGDLLYQCKTVRNYQIVTDMSQYTLAQEELPQLRALTVGEMA